MKDESRMVSTCDAGGRRRLELRGGKVPGGRPMQEQVGLVRRYHRPLQRRLYMETGLRNDGTPYAAAEDTSGIDVR